MIRAALGLLLAAALALPALAAEVREIVTPGGLRARLVEAPEIPMLALELRFPGGASQEPAARAGVTRMTAALLSEGAGELDAAAFEAATDDVALRFGVSARRDSVAVSARMLTETRAESVELLRLALTAPRFDPEAVERVRARALSGIRSDETDPGALAARAWRAAVFPDDPYGRPADGTLETVQAVGAEDLRAAHRRMLNREGVSIAVVGDIDAAAAAALLDRLLLDLPAEPRAPLPPVAPQAEGGLTVVPLDAPQATARLIQPGIGREDPDFYAAVVLNHILGGGGFGSRLMEEVRVARGLAYSVSSFLVPFDRAAVLGAQVSSDAARIAEALEVIRAEWRRLREEGPTEAEVEDAKRHLTGAWPLAFDSNAALASNLASFMADGLPPDWIEARNVEVARVNHAEVVRVARRLLTPEALEVVVVGRPEGLAAD